MTVLRWSEQAVRDLESIRDFIGRDSPRYGQLVVERLVEATSRIETFPKAGRVVPEVGIENVRELIVGDYRIVYRLDDELAVLVTVYRSSMLFPFRLFGE